MVLHLLCLLSIVSSHCTFHEPNANVPFIGASKLNTSSSSSRSLPLYKRLLFLEFGNPLGRTGFKVGWEKHKHKKVTKKRPRILGSPGTHSRRRGEQEEDTLNDGPLFLVQILFQAFSVSHPLLVSSKASVFRTSMRDLTKTKTKKTKKKTKY